MAVSDDVRESWETSDGGFVPEFDGVIRKALFTYKNEYQNGEACVLELLIEPCEDDAIEFGDALDDDGLYSEIYLVGKGFEPADKGAKVQHESGRKRKFPSRSKMGLLMNHAVDLDGLGDELMGRGTAYEAKVWEGLDLHFEQVEFSYNDRDGDKVTYNVRLPTAFNGADGDEPTKPAKKAPAKKAPAKKAAPVESEESEESDAPTHKLPPKLRGQLKAIAANAEDHDAFMEAAFAELTLDDDAEAAVADEDFFLSIKAG